MHFSETQVARQAQLHYAMKGGIFPLWEPCSVSGLAEAKVDGRVVERGRDRKKGRVGDAVAATASRHWQE